MTCLMLLIVMSSLFIACNKQETEKTVIVDHVLWPSYTYDEIIDESVYIVYGKVINVGATTGHVIAENNGKPIYEYLTPTEIEVIETYKGDNSDTITYLQHSGETDTNIYVVEGTLTLDIGDEAMLFIGDEGVSLMPDTVFPVTDGALALPLFMAEGMAENAPDGSAGTPEAFDMITVDEFSQIISAKIAKSMD